LLQLEPLTLPSTPLPHEPTMTHADLTGRGRDIGTLIVDLKRLNTSMRWRRSAAKNPQKCPH
jgi:hypothetical protein